MRHGYYLEVGPIVRKFHSKGINVFYFCGGRGIGKTYSALDCCREIGTKDWILDESMEQNRFLYLRRTAVEAQSIAAPESCPFKTYNRNEGYAINAEFNTKLGFGEFFLDDEKTQHIGYCAALSTFANLRGIDFVDVSFILYDECIPENKNKHVLKDEGFLLLNMIETINRNRLIEGLPEVILVMLSNPIDLGSPFLSQLVLTPIINNMIFKGQDKYTGYSRSVHIEKLTNHIVSKDKENSFLYKFAAPTGFNERALSGDFLDNDLDLIRKPDLAQYKAFLTIENICVYKHKAEESYYISQTLQPSEYTFRAYEKEKLRAVFYWRYKLLIVERKVFYDNFNTKIVFEAMIRYKPLP